ncbi:MAG TPA: hypothetical protein VJ992_03255 [Gemmatimonadales bacterium]|jgi:hypothetical protein|nr:hypothetical protein [Gemmatimonadales bacterium]
MSRTLSEQRWLNYRGRAFHFVSYEGQPANTKQARPATPPAWWLMSAGTRWEVMPYQPGRDGDELDRAFTAWLDTHVFPTSDARRD